jgi:hypothetical protein
MALAPTVLAAFAYSSFFFRRFRSVVEDDGVRFVTCLALVLAPVGQILLVSHTDYSIWNALFCALLWAWVPLPDSPWRAALSVAGQQLLVWSHPVSMVAAPINAAQAWNAKNRGQRLAQGAMLAGHAFHLALGLDHRYAGRATLGTGFGDWPQRFVLFEHKAVARALFGTHLYGRLAAHGGAWVLVLGTLVLFAGAVWVAWRNVAGLRLAVVLAAYSLTGVALCVAASRATRQIEQGFRYLYVQRLFTVMLLTLVVHGTWQRFRPSPGVPRREPAYPAPYAVLLAALFGLQHLGRAPRDRYRNLNAERVAACMQRLTSLQARNGGPCGFSLRCPKRRDWGIVFHPRRCYQGHQSPVSTDEPSGGSGSD